MREEHFTSSYDGTRIWYSSIGSGELTIIPCNGVLCTTTFWKFYESYFKDRCRFITWDYRGHGRSGAPPDTEALQIPDYAKDLKAVMDHAGVKKAILLGHSMGVQVILEFYRLFPERVQGLAPVCGPFEKPFSAVIESKRLEKAVVPLLDFWAFQGEAIGVWMRPFLRSSLAVPLAMKIGCNEELCPPDLMVRYYDHIAGMDFKIAFKALKHMQRHSARDMLGTIKVPLLIIAGDNDKMTPLKVSREMQKLVPGSELFVVAKGEHTALIEQPEVINKRLEKWLTAHFGLGRPRKALPAGAAPPAEKPAKKKAPAKKGIKKAAVKKKAAPAE